MQPMLNIALRAARSAGELIFRSIERLDVISVNEKDAKDYVTEVDRAAEQTIVAALRKAYPTHAIMGEEGGFIEGSGEGADYLWVIDPLDGTTNFIHGVPHFAVSIACKYKGRLEHAVVLDPVRQEEFTASRGRGAALNGRRLRVSGRKSLEGALLGTGFPFRDNQIDNLDNYLNMFRSLVGQTAGIRRAGAASLDLAYVAAGRYDAFWGIRPVRMGHGGRRPAGTGSRRPGERLHRQPRIPREGSHRRRQHQMLQGTADHHPAAPAAVAEALIRR